ncbi:MULTISPECIES: amidohydrolase family protein [Rhodococcus]|uniref:Amidohydrolase family protein n=1 Tax=Rhodococcus oxybenzonivorans TaxID=1990687 RepID=A0AAE4UX06_9NOCA|nr:MULTISPECIES: amidohydrolase family protein [Rhodococcus]MDV7241626.1 amidohydrolase family protein [Rhodococcus oxybenzonivorans]MDV7264211.1 amidohydrolase family protein [Rhodococcus oxybenzonivorans]MDV7273841.1 amidohydrolase family protein [Rhodococcus oxybenzonivorans]MDV7333907.1 amidohydrolase family protein [Rhodococcus oxybenzonivorans]MDV7343326.1 amidohydrolase family protein [Rhodococcus oxybenzonivorans]
MTATAAAETGQKSLSTTPYILVSTDGHVGPSLTGQLREYCPAEYLEEFDRYAEANAGPVAFVGTNDMQSERKQSEAQREAVRLAFECRGQQDPHVRIKDMNADGVAAEVIFAGGQNDEVLPFLSPLGLSVDGVDAQLQQVGQQIYNRWLADFVTVEPERHVGLVHVPIWDIDEAIKAVRWGHEHGLKGVNFPAPRRGLTAYNDPAYDPFWRVVEELDMPLCAHSGGGETPLGITGPGGMELFQSEALWLGRRAIHQMIFGGVFERFPGLKLVFCEQRTAWVPQTIADLDSIYYGATATPFVKKLAPPSEYYRRNCFIGGSFLAPFEAAQRYEVGVDNLMWGTDYPHQEGTWPNTALAVRNTFHSIPEDETRKILGETAVRVFNFDADKLRKISDRIGPQPADVARPVPASELPAHRGFAFRERGQYS